MLLSAVAGAASAGGASAPDLAELPLDALLDMQVSGASKFSLRMSETAASVTVITAAEMRALGHRTLADVLRGVRGLMVDDDRTYSYLGVRGFFAPGDYNTRVLLLVDGMRTNDVVYDQAYLGREFPLDLDLVERVEFIPGQASAVYGANALFGVVNIVTRAPDTRVGEGISLRWGSGHERQLRLAHTHRWDNGLVVQWSASRLLADGRDLVMPELATATAPDGVARHADYERRSALTLRAAWDRTQLTLMHAKRLDGAPLIPGAVFGDPRTTNYDEHTLLDLTHTTELGAADQLVWRGFAGRYRFVGRYAFDQPPVIINRDDAGGRWWGGELRWLSQRWHGHRVSVGLEGQQVGRLYQRNQDLDDEGTLHLDDRRRTHRVAVFAEDQVELGEHWGLNLALRHDRDHGQSPRWSPRVALLWRPTPEWVLKAIHGRAYRPPNAFESWYEVHAVGGYKRNPQVRPESVRGSEFALEWRPTVHDRISASLYRNRATQLLVLQHDPADDLLEFRNLGSLRAQGLELEWERLWRGGTRLRASMSLQRASDSGEGLAAYAPRRAAKLAAIVPLGGDWTWGTEVQALSRRGPAAGHALVHLTLAKALPLQGWAASLHLEDALDRQPDDLGPEPQQVPRAPQRGRSVTLRLDWSF